MVYLDIYDTIFEFLEKIGIVDSVFEYSDDFLEPLMPNNISNKFYNEFIIEFALFNYKHKNEVLIDFLEKNLYNSLSKIEKKEFEAIKKSERHNLKFVKKIKLNKLDTINRELYDFYFTDIDINLTKIIISSSPLDDNKFVMNARLIQSSKYNEKYHIIGGFFDEKTYKNFLEYCNLKAIKDGFKESVTMIEHLLEFGKTHSLKEIDEYENKKSRFIKQDRKIMMLNKQFFEKFNIGFDDYLKNFYGLSNDEKFIEMTEYYLSILKELKDLIINTNYIVGFSLWHENYLINGFLAFLKKDSNALEESIINMQKEEKKEFENSMKNEIAFTREKIMEHEKEFLMKNIAPIRLNDFDSFMEKLNGFTPKNISEFLEEVIKYLRINMKKINVPDIDIVFGFTEVFAKDINDSPYLIDVENRQKNIKYHPEIFYEYMSADDKVISLTIFLLVVHHAYKNELDKAYSILKQNKIDKTESFNQMFMIGKIFTFFGNDAYKSYFKKAKEIDKVRYKSELETFLKQNQQKIFLV